MAFVGSDGPIQSRSLAVGELLGTAAQDHPDPVERVVLAAAVPVDLLLDPASDFDRYIRETTANGPPTTRNEQAGRLGAGDPRREFPAVAQRGPNPLRG